MNDLKQATSHFNNTCACAACTNCPGSSCTCGCQEGATQAACGPQCQCGQGCTCRQS